MQVNTFAKHLTDIEKGLFEDYLGKKLLQFEKFLTHFDVDEVKLNVTAEKFTRKDAYKVEMFMELPKAVKHKPLYSSEDSRDLRKAVEFSKDKLIDQIKKAVEKMQREHLRAA
jgi:ribosomal subunit interface protein